MTSTNPALRHSCAALAAAGALAVSAGSAAAQQAYQGMPQPQPVYQAPPAYAPYRAPPGYQPQAAWQAPADYPPQVAYQPPPAYPAAPAYPPETTYRTVNEITVIAPSVHHREVGRSDTGIPLEELTASRVVDISDLDLSRQQDVDMMDYRVRMAAINACDTLDREYPRSMYPTYPSEDDHCVARATNAGVEQEHEAVAAAEAIAYAAAAYRR